MKRSILYEIYIYIYMYIARLELLCKRSITRFSLAVSSKYPQYRRTVSLRSERCSLRSIIRAFKTLTMFTTIRRRDPPLPFFAMRHSSFRMLSGLSAGDRVNFPVKSHVLLGARGPPPCVPWVRWTLTKKKRKKREEGKEGRTYRYRELAKEYLRGETRSRLTRKFGKNGWWQLGEGKKEIPGGEIDDATLETRKAQRFRKKEAVAAREKDRIPGEFEIL
ncbi:unnamed protein product [Xylocopa violacea]|uniref:Uncharacterized protein n=1 Tax=Xylocopa violacea TaxID=135666 RepID=A0ABP1MXZ4_XYLVO